MPENSAVYLEGTPWMTEGISSRMKLYFFVGRGDEFDLIFPVLLLLNHALVIEQGMLKYIIPLVKLHYSLFKILYALSYSYSALIIKLMV